MSDIQQARETLAKWRSESTQGDWHLGDRDPAPGWEHHRAIDVGPAGAITDYIDSAGAITDYIDPADARLIVGIVGNTDLLDAIDDMLKLAANMSSDSIYPFSNFGRVADRITATIIAADERMTS